MADTLLEIYLDQYVKENLRLHVSAYEKTGNSWKYHGVANFNDNTEYRMDLFVNNNGTETYVKNIQIRCVRRNSRVHLYEDDTFTNEVPRSDSPTFPDTVEPGHFSQIHKIYFKLDEGPDQYGEVVRYGIYAEVIPQGHSWKSLMRGFD